MIEWPFRTLPTVISTLIALVAIVLAVAVAYFVDGRSARGLPYHDSFASGKTDEWHPFGGTWEVADGAIRDDSNERGAKLITGSPKWTNYFMEGDMMLQSVVGVASDFGFVVRSSNEEQGVYAYRGYFALLHKEEGEGALLLLGRVGQGTAVLASVPLPSDLQTQTWYHMKFLAVGCRLIASVHSLNSSVVSVAEADDPHCLAQGRAGLLSSHAGGIWRNIVIQSATEKDADSMHALIPAQASLAQSIPSLRDAALPLTAAAISRQQDRAIPATIPISTARLESLISPVRATISGQVILTSPELFVQDSTGGILVRSLNSSQLKIGDEITTTGTLSAHGLACTMENAALRVLWEGTPIPAKSVTASRIATGAYNGEYIEVDGLLTGKHYISSDMLALDFSAASQTYEAIVHGARGADQFWRIEPQSVVRLRGVATLDPRFRNDQTAFVVLVRSIDDIKVVSGPPWWRFRNLVLIAALLILLLAASGFLYRRIERSKLFAVIEEREHLAYELHDTLAQSVAGIGFQLEAIRSSVPPEQTGLQKQLEFARELVLHSHAEARQSVDILRSQNLQERSLLSALKDCAGKLISGSNVTVITESIGTPRPVSLKCTDALFRIGQEALVNAVRHAVPTSLKLVIEYEKRYVTLSIQDNGQGFCNEPNHHTLGIMSMQKRAEAISADLTIRSAPGEGTIVTVRAPFSGKSRLPSLCQMFRLKRVAS